MSEFDDYVEGDVNSTESSDGASAPVAQAALTYIAQALADNPDSVEVSVQERSGKVVLSLTVAPDDMGRIIGRRGRTAQAIRAVIAAAGVRDGVTTSVDIID